jgi:hypothetical protein
MTRSKIQPLRIDEGPSAAPKAQMAGLQASERFFNRDLSWLAFNARVLQEAANPRVPILERMKFLDLAHNAIEDVSALARDEEKARLDLTTRILTDVTGRRPAGWFSLPRQTDPFAGGSISPNTMDLLIEAGYAYMGNGLADDIPHYWVTDFASRRAILTLPYYYHFDDQFFSMFPVRGSGLENSDMLLRNWRAELDAQYKRGRFFTMTLHPQHIGWCNRMAGLEDFLAHMTSLPDLWNPTGAECARFWKQTYPTATHLELEPSIWNDYPGSLS